MPPCGLKSATTWQRVQCILDIDLPVIMRAEVSCALAVGVMLACDIENSKDKHNKGAGFSIFDLFAECVAVSCILPINPVLGQLLGCFFGKEDGERWSLQTLAHH